MPRVQPKDHATPQKPVMILELRYAQQSLENLDLSHSTHKGLGHHPKLNDQ